MYQAMSDFKKFLSDNVSQNVQIAPGVSYSITDVLVENRRFFHSMFKKPKTPSGLKKIFYNVGYIYYNTQYKHTDIDFKDLSVVATNDAGIVAANIIRGVIQSYVSKANPKGEKPDKIINQVREAMLQDGVVYVKLVGDTPYVVDPFNIIEPANQDNLGTLAEKITNKTVEQIRRDYEKDVKKKDKDKFNDILQKCEEDEINPIIYEYWKPGETPMCEVWISATEETPTDDKVYDNWDELSMKVCEFPSPVKDQFGRRTMPYAKGHNIHVRGRRIGFSVFEIVKGIIYNYNEIMNMNREKALLDLRGLFVFKKGFNSRAIPQSFMNKIGLGGFLELEAGEDIQRLPYQYIAGEVLSVANTLFETGRQLTGVTSMDIGEKLPSRVSATAIVDNRKNAQSSYDVTIENMSIVLSDFLERVWAPTILRKLTKEEAIAITGSLAELKAMDELVVTQSVYKELNDVKKEYGFYGIMVNGQPIPVLEQWEIDEIIKQRMENVQAMGEVRFVNVKNSLLKSIQYSCRFIVGAERIDKESKLQTLIAWRQTVTNPFTAEKLDMRIADLVGEDPKLFKLTDKERDMALQMTGKIQGQQNLTGQPLSPEVNSPNRML